MGKSCVSLFSLLVTSFCSFLSAAWTLLVTVRMLQFMRCYLTLLLNFNGLMVRITRPDTAPRKVIPIHPALEALRIVGTVARVDPNDITTMISSTHPTRSIKYFALKTISISSKASDKILCCRPRIRKSSVKHSVDCATLCESLERVSSSITSTSAQSQTAS